MARLGDIELLDHSTGLNGGGAFLLAKPCDADETIRLASGWEVELQEGNPYAVARGRGADDHNTAYVASLEAVQQGLDLLAICNLGLNTIQDASMECIIWWKRKGVQAIRLSAVQQFGISSPITRLAISKTNGSKHLLFPNLGHLNHHESMRFYRFSQMSNDLFDAYRNLWLAMETLLDSVLPRPARASETTWIEQAFSEILRLQASAEGVLDSAKLIGSLWRSTFATGSFKLDEVLRDASECAPNLPSAAVFVAEQYKETRCRLFHSGRHLSHEQLPPLLPDKLEDRVYLRKKLVELSWIYRQAAAIVFKIRAAYGYWPTSFLDEMLASRLIGEASITVTSDPSLLDNHSDDIEITPCNPIRLATVPAVHEVIALRAYLGTAEFTMGCNPSSIVSANLMFGDECVLRNDLEVKLQLDGVSKLEVFMAYWSQETDRPESVFPDPPWLI